MALIIGISILVLVEVAFILRSRPWIREKIHPSLFFLVALGLLFFLFFSALSLKNEMTFAHSIVFSLDPRMKERDIAEAKDIIKKSISELTCSVGLIRGDGVWLCPLSEDRVFFLIQLEGILPGSSASDTPFPYEAQSVADNVLIVFSSRPQSWSNEKEFMSFCPINGQNVWECTSRNLHTKVSAQGVLARIKEKGYWSDDGAESIEKEKYLFMLFVIGAFLYRFRTLVPLLCCLYCFVPLRGETDFRDIRSSHLASILSQCNEQKKAIQLLEIAYRTEVVEQKRSIFAFNLALLYARSQDFSTSLFWLRRVDMRVYEQEKVLMFARDLLSSILLSGDGNEDVKQELLRVVSMIGSCQVAQGALLVLPSQEACMIPGIDVLGQQVTSPEILYLSKKWKQEILQLLSLHRPSFNGLKKALDEQNIHKVAVILLLGSGTPTWGKAQWLAQLCYREARLFDLLCRTLPQDASWMKQMFFLLVKNNQVDTRLGLKKTQEMFFEAAWEMDQDVMNRWKRLEYFTCVLENNMTSPWKRAILSLYLVEPYQAQVLSFLLQQMGVASIDAKSKFETVLASFLDIWIQQEAKSLQETFNVPQDIDELSYAIYHAGGAQGLCLFFQKSVSLFRKIYSLEQNPLFFIEKCKEVVFQLSRFFPFSSNSELFLQCNHEMINSLSQAIEKQMTTLQEQAILTQIRSFHEKQNKFDTEVKEGIEYLQTSYQMLDVLANVVRQEHPENVDSSLSRNQTQGSVSFSVPLENAVQLLLEMEREEQELLDQIQKGQL